MSSGELTVRVPGFSKLRDESIGGSLELSVDVFNERMGLVEQTYADSTVTLEEGKYVVAVTMPDGAKSTQVVRVLADDATTATLKWAAPQRSRAIEKSEAKGYSKVALGAAPAEFLMRYVKIGPDGATEPLGLPPSTEVLDADSDARRLAVSMALQVMDADEMIRFAQLRVPEIGQVTVALPLAQVFSSDHCRLDVSITAALIETDVRFVQSPEADYLAQLLETHQVEEAANFKVLESLLQGKMSDPVGAALAAYALLRRGEIDEQLSNWIENLAGFAWLPDGLAVQAALRAESRDPLGALASAAKALNTGWPIFTDGLSLLDQTLRGLARKHEDAIPHLESLATVLPYVDFTEVSTTLRHGPSELGGVDDGQGWRTFRIPHVLTDPSDYWE